MNTGAEPSLPGRDRFTLRHCCIRNLRKMRGESHSRCGGEAVKKCDSNINQEKGDCRRHAAKASRSALFVDSGG